MRQQIYFTCPKFTCNILEVTTNRHKYKKIKVTGIDVDFVVMVLVT